MQFYFAPMEGITGYIYRNIHKKLFPGMDKYFTPFVVANQTYHFKTKEKKDVAPENNRDIHIVPQIMSNKAEEFIWAAEEMKKLGYQEVNLNLGCPAATVVSKKKGSGFLAYPEELDAFLDTIFQKLEGSGLNISVKTRIGRDHEAEAERLISIYNQYPLSELIVHPRVQKDFYKKEIHLDIFEQIATNSKHSICYNGDLFTVEDYKRFTARFPQIKAVMLGRGLLANPALVRHVQKQEPITCEDLRTYHDTVYRAYCAIPIGEVNTLYRMKELWAYMGQMFPEGERFLKKVRKAKHGAEYEVAVAQLFASCEMTGSYKGF